MGCQLFLVLCYLLAFLEFTETVSDPQTLVWVASESSTGKSEITKVKGNPYNWIQNSENFRKTQYSFRCANCYQMVGLAFWYKKKYLLFSDSKYGTVQLLMDVNGRYESRIFSVGNSQVVSQLTVDWLSGNVYWTDSLFKWIIIQHITDSPNNFKPKQKVIIDTYLENPVGIAVHPLKRYLFWTDSGKRPKIERSHLDGSHRKTLIMRALEKPMLITIDHAKDRIYWVDAVRQTMESADLDGQTRQKHLYKSNTQLFGIAIFQNIAFLTDNQKDVIQMVEKSTGQLKPGPIKNRMTPYGIVMYSQYSQPPGNSSCKVKNCQEICLEDEMGAKCMCGTGKQLKSSKNCADEKGPFPRSILCTNGTHLWLHYLSNLFIRSDLSIMRRGRLIGTGLHHVEYMTIDIQNKILYYSSTTSPALYIRNLVTNAESSPNLKIKQKISGLSYDWVNKLVYISTSEDTILYYNTRSNRTRVLKTGLHQPSFITADPLKSILFWIESKDDNKKIMKANTRGGQHQMLVPIDSKLNPQYLAYDQYDNRLFWTEKGKVSSIDSDGLHRRNWPQPVFNENFAVSVIKSYVIWLWKNNSHFFLEAQVKDNKEKDLNWTFSRNLLPLVEIIRVKNFLVFDKQLQIAKTEKCEMNNGGCQDFCVLDGIKRRCECQHGLVLDTDGKSCVSEFEKLTSGDFMILSDSFKKASYVVEIVSKKFAKLPIQYNSKTGGIGFDLKRQIFYWTADNFIKKFSFFTKKEETLRNLGVYKPQQLSVDVSTGNIFYTAVKDKNGYIGVISPSGEVAKILIKLTPNPYAIALYPAKGLMFWTSGDSNNTIRRANMDGSRNSGIVVDKLEKVLGLTIDYAYDRLYWCHQNKIESSSLDGSQRNVLHSDDGGVLDIAAFGSDIFYATDKKMEIKYVSINGTQPMNFLNEDILFSQLKIIRKKQEIKYENPFCADQNGQCSTLCLPTQSKFRCACSDGVALNGKRCVNVEECSPIEHVQISPNCLKFSGMSCTYECDNGFKPVTSSKQIVCLENGKWNNSVVCKKMVDSSPQNLVRVVALVSAGVVVILIILVIVLYRVRFICRRERKPEPNMHFHKEEIYDVIDENMQNPVNLCYTGPQHDGYLTPSRKADQENINPSESLKSERYKPFPKGEYLRTA